MVLKYLDEKKIPYQMFEHPAVYTVEEAQKYADNIPGIHYKNLFLRNKNGKKHYLLVLEENRKVDLKEIARIIHAKNLSFASKDRLKKYLDLEPGSVSPFGLLNDLDRVVEVYLDSSIADGALVAFHPNDNTKTLVLDATDLLKILRELGYELTMI